jgi:hypothetical protein
MYNTKPTEYGPRRKSKCKQCCKIPVSEIYVILVKHASVVANIISIRNAFS